MDPVTLGILLASGGLVALAIRDTNRLPTLAIRDTRRLANLDESDWEAFLELDVARMASKEQKVAFDKMQELGMAPPERAVVSKEDLFELFAVDNEALLSYRIGESAICDISVRLDRTGLTLQEGPADDVITRSLAFPFSVSDLAAAVAKMEEVSLSRDLSSTHVCGGDILFGSGYFYCNRCRAFSYSRSLPRGTNLEVNMEAWDNGEDQSPDRIE